MDPLSGVPSYRTYRGAAGFEPIACEARRISAVITSVAGENMTTDALRDHLLDVLNSGHAHQDFDSAVDAVPADLRGKRPPGAPHSPWELLEHMRIAQWDILEYSLDAKHVSPEFPKGYWPASPEPPSEKAWDESVAKFRADREKLSSVIKDESIDLFAKI